MNIPNIPSDNIYKFIALSSLAILIIVNLYFFTETRKIYEDMMDVDIDIVKLEKDISVIEFELDYWMKRMEKELKKFVDAEKLKSIDTSLSNVDQLVYLIDLTDSMESSQKDKVTPFLVKFREDGVKLKKMAMEVGLKEDIVKINNEKVFDYYSEIKRLRTMFFILLPILLFFLVYGFGNWYWKVQKYQDIILKNQAERFISESK